MGARKTWVLTPEWIINRMSPQSTDNVANPTRFPSPLPFINPRLSMCIIMEVLKVRFTYKLYLNCSGKWNQV